MAKYFFLFQVAVLENLILEPGYVSLKEIKVLKKLMFLSSISFATKLKNSIKLMCVQ